MQNQYYKIKKVLIVMVAFTLIVNIIRLVSGLANSTPDLFSFANGFNGISIISLAIISYLHKESFNKYMGDCKKIESIIALFIGLILLIVGYQIFTNATDSFKQNHTIDISAFNVMVMVIITSINSFIVYYGKTKGQAYNSPVLISNAKHVLTDIIISSSMIMAFVGTKYLSLPKSFSSIFALVAAVAIFKLAFGIVKQAIDTLISNEKIETPTLR